MANVTIKDKNGNQLTVSQDAWLSNYQPSGKYTLVSSGQGSTGSSTQFKEGSAYKFADSASVYVFNNGKLEKIPDENTFYSMYGGKPQQNLNYTTIGRETIGTIKLSETPTTFKGKNVKAPASQNQGSSNAPIDSNSPAQGASPGIGATSGIADEGLIKFSDSPAVYLVDHDTKALIPFESETAFTTYASRNGIDVNEAWNSIDEIDRTDSRIQGYVSSTAMISSNGVKPEVSALNGSTIKARYGQANDENSNYKSYLALDGFLNILKADSRSGIDPMTIDNLLKDPLKVGGLMSALSYGGYTLSDVYRELKRQDLVAKGNTTLTTAAIDPSQTKDAYSATTKGKTVYDDSQLALPSTLQGITDMNLFNLKIFQMPDTLFNELVPILDENSAEFQKQLSELKDMYSEVAMTQVNARTEQDKAVADENYRQLQETAKKNFGIQLSNNALSAWDQIESLGSSQTTRGLENTGVANKEVDKYLRSVRRSDQLARDSNMTNEDINKMNYYRSSATEAEIAALTPEERAKYKLTPSADVASKLDVNYLMNTYGMTKEAAEKKRNETLDANGNYRSTLYATERRDLTTLEAQKKATLRDKLLEEAQQKEKIAYADVTNAEGSQFSSNVNEDTIIEDPFKKSQKASQAAADAMNSSVDTISTGQVTPQGSSSGLVTIKEKKTGITHQVTKDLYDSTYKNSNLWSLG